jgi:hypothetical protein
MPPAAWIPLKLQLLCRGAMAAMASEVGVAINKTNERLVRQLVSWLLLTPETWPEFRVDSATTTGAANQTPAITLMKAKHIYVHGGGAAQLLAPQYTGP